MKKLTILAQLLCTKTDEAGGCGVSPFPLVPTYGWVTDGEHLNLRQKKQ